MIYTSDKIKLTPSEFLKKYNKYFSMKAICELAGYNYDTYKSWNIGRSNTHDNNLKVLTDAMLHLFDEDIKEEEKKEG